MLGISLLLVGIVLVHNGIMFMSKVKQEKILEGGETTVEIVPLIVKSPKSIAFFNVIVGAILLIANFVLLATHVPIDLAAAAADPYALPRYLVFNNIAAGMVFGVTYLFIAGNLLFKLDIRPFAWFCMGASIFALVMTGYNFYHFAQADSFAHTPFFLGLLWLSWFILWFTAPLEFIFKIKPMQKIFPWVSITVGIVGAFVPAILLLTGVWPML